MYNYKTVSFTIYILCCLRFFFLNLRKYFDLSLSFSFKSNFIKILIYLVVVLNGFWETKGKFNSPTYDIDIFYHFIDKWEIANFNY